MPREQIKTIFVYEIHWDTALTNQYANLSKCFNQTFDLISIQIQILNGLLNTTSENLSKEDEDEPKLREYAECECSLSFMCFFLYKSSS